MDLSPVFFINSVLLGVGLAMDAFSVSLANGLHAPHMRRPEMARIAGTYAFFQFLMPMLGWLGVHTIIQSFTALTSLIPWIALILLCLIGGDMLLEGIRSKPEEKGSEKNMADDIVGNGKLILQGIATSIDALSVGFATAEYSAGNAFLSSVIIAVVTFAICIGGLILGRIFGIKLKNKASILGGCILIGIGLEIFISHFF